MLALPPTPGWSLRAQADETGVTELLDRDGASRSYIELRAQAGDRYLAELTPEVWNHKYQRCMNAIARLGDDIRSLQPDLLVIIGDDQEEIFTSKNNPSIAISYAPTVQSAGPETPSGSSSGFRRGMGMDGNIYPGDPEAAVTLIREMVQRGFDISAVSGLEEKGGFGHAFTWVLSRVLNSAMIGTIPLLLNTYFPPNQPTPRRCFELGQVLREACEALPGDRRVVVVASGGLSHFAVDAELDEAVLDAIRDHDAAALEQIPTTLLNSGTSEIRNWIAMSGASEGLTSRWTEYQPVYRTAAGTGCGLAFTILS